MSILRHKNKFLIFSAILIVLSLASVFYFGFRYGIDFKSGSLWQLKIPNSNPGSIRDFFKSDFGISDLVISFDPNSQNYSLTLREITDSERQDYLAKLKQKFGEGVESLDFLTVSPTVSTELRHKAIWAIVLVLLGISLYIAFAFRRVSRPISSWKYGVVALITLIHDVAIPAAVFALLGRILGVAVDSNFVVALLFVMGFSIHDTIVVFDRIRENLTIFREKINLGEIVDRSIIQTLHRSINTSLTLILVLLSVYFWGPANIQWFILTILIGVITGTYSSILFASPLLVVWEKLGRRRR